MTSRQLPAPDQVAARCLADAVATIRQQVETAFGKGPPVHLEDTPLGRSIQVLAAATTTPSWSQKMRSDVVEACRFVREAVPQVAALDDPGVRPSSMLGAMMRLIDARSELIDFEQHLLFGDPTVC